VAAGSAAIAAPTQPTGRHPQRPRALAAPGVVAYPAGGEDGLSTDDPLTAFKRANVYPPTSQPLTRDQDDLLHPNRRHELPRPTDADDGIEFLFTADKYFVVGDDVLTAKLAITRDGKPVAAKITQAFAATLDPTRPSTDADKLPLAYAAQPDGSLVATFAPSIVPKLARQTAFGMYVEFDDGTGHGLQRGHFDFQYTPSGGVPARFTGRFSDEIVNGSLVIHAGVEVATAGHYVLDCNLYDATGNPVGWTRFKSDLAAGTQQADLMFFGKVIADAHVSGPFEIGELRGARFVPGSEPDLEQMASFTGSYATRAYQPGDFSAADYDSDDKQRMVQFLSDQQAKGVHQGAATRGDPGKTGDDH
jgi:hypothetical protein